MDGAYGASNGWNWAGIIAFVVGVIPNLPGFAVQAGIIGSAPDIFNQLYIYSWFVGFIIAGIVYYILSAKRS